MVFTVANLKFFRLAHLPLFSDSDSCIFDPFATHQYLCKPVHHPNELMIQSFHEKYVSMHDIRCTSRVQKVRGHK